LALHRRVVRLLGQPIVFVRGVRELPALPVGEGDLLGGLAVQLVLGVGGAEGLQDARRRRVVLEGHEGGAGVVLGGGADGRGGGGGADAQEVVGGGAVVLRLLGGLPLLVDGGGEV